MVEVLGDDVLLEELGIKDGKGSSMLVPADNLVTVRVRHDFPDGFDELGYNVPPHSSIPNIYWKKRLFTGLEEIDC